MTNGPKGLTGAMNPHFKYESDVDLSTILDIQQFVDEVDDREIHNNDERIERIRRIAERDASLPR